MKIQNKNRTFWVVIVSFLCGMSVSLGASGNAVEITGRAGFAVAKKEQRQQLFLGGIAQRIQKVGSDVKGFVWGHGSFVQHVKRRLASFVILCASGLMLKQLFSVQALEGGDLVGGDGENVNGSDGGDDEQEAARGQEIEGEEEVVGEDIYLNDLEARRAAQIIEEEKLREENRQAEVKQQEAELKQQEETERRLARYVLSEEFVRNLSDDEKVVGSIVEMSRALGMFLINNDGDYRILSKELFDLSFSLWWSSYEYAEVQFKLATLRVMWFRDKDSFKEAAVDFAKQFLLAGEKKGKDEERKIVDRMIQDMIEKATEELEGSLEQNGDDFAEVEKVLREHESEYEEGKVAIDFILSVLEVIKSERMENGDQFLRWRYQNCQAACVECARKLLIAQERKKGERDEKEDDEKEEWSAQGDEGGDRGAGRLEVESVVKTVLAESDFKAMKEFLPSGGQENERIVLMIQEAIEELRTMLSENGNTMDKLVQSFTRLKSESRSNGLGRERAMADFKLSVLFLMQAKAEAYDIDGSRLKLCIKDCIFKAQALLKSE